MDVTLQDLNIGGLRAFLSLLGGVADALAFFEALVARSLDGGKVGKEVFATAVRRNEAVAFFRIEPLDDTGFHADFHLKDERHDASTR